MKPIGRTIASQAWHGPKQLVGIDILACMFDESVRLVLALNSLSHGAVTAAEAELMVRRDAGSEHQEPHHVHDPDQLLGLDPLAGVPLRLALARIGHGALGPAPVWALLLPRPGRMAGLRGPLEVNRAALEAEAVVMTHDGSLAWLGQRVGAGVQWRLARAERPLPVPDPREASRQLSRVVASAAQAMAGLDLSGGAHPELEGAPRLGGAFPRQPQALLERAWMLLGAVDAALDSQHEVLHSHAVLTRERHLRELQQAALDAVSAACSWPAEALQD